MLKTKFVKPVLLITALMLLVSALSSCGFEASLSRMTEQERAVAVYNRAMVLADEKKSYEMAVKSHIEGELMGVDFSVDVTGSSVEYVTEDDYANVITTETKSVIGEESETAKTS